MPFIEAKVNKQLLLLLDKMVNFWNVVNKVIKEADVLLIVLDARLVEDTMHAELEKKIKASRKPYINVITKSDLVKNKKDVEKYKKQLHPCVFISAKENLGTTILRNRIIMMGKRVKERGELIKVGVFGYPNVGKSSLINVISGKGSASTSSMSGHTKGIQKVRSDNQIMFLDTPGVIPFKEKDNTKHTIIGTIDFTKAKDPDIIVMQLMERFPGKVERYYGVKEDEDLEEVIEAIAVKKRILKKGNEADIERASRTILKDWQKGNIK